MNTTVLTRTAVVPSQMNPIGAEGNMFASLIDKVPAKRVGNIDDLAGTIIYLCSRAGVSTIVELAYLH